MAYRGELFGRKRFATISGIMAPFRTIGSVAGPVFAGYAYDVTGSYRFAFLVFTLLAALSAASFYMIKSERI
jgi:MFS family permease